MIALAFTWIYVLQYKHDVASILLRFKSMVENQFSTTIKSVQTDGGREFRPLYSVFASNGIVHRISCLYTPQQNGRVEKKNKHVVEVGLLFLAQSFLPKSYWSYAFQTIVFLINRLPTHVLQL